MPGYILLCLTKHFTKLNFYINGFCSIPVRKINQKAANTVPDKFLSLLLEYIFVCFHALAVSDVLDVLMTDTFNVNGCELSFYICYYLQEYQIMQAIGVLLANYSVLMFLFS